MKRLAFIAALAAGPAMAESPPSLIPQVMAKTPCADLFRIVIESDTQSTAEREIELLAWGIIYGRAIGHHMGDETFGPLVEAEILRFVAECDVAPDKNWIVGIMALQPD